MTKLETLKAVKALIEDPKHWTQGAMARTSDGSKSYADSASATCWCIAGAYYRIAGNAAANDRTWQAIYAAGELLFNEDVIFVNDTFGHAAVMQVLDAAIAEAEKTG